MIDVSLSFSDGRLLDVLQEAYRSADRLEKKITELQSSLSKGLAQPPNAGRLNEAMKNSAKSAGDAEKAFSKFGASAGLSFAKFNIAASALEQVGISFVNIATAPIKFAASLEQVETNFTTFLGSAEAAKELIAELNKFAADTPFAQSEIFGQAEKLLGFGFSANEATDSIKRLGDISGGSIEKLDGLVLALGQVRAKQKVQAEELLQFAERGVPIYEALAQSIGVSVPELNKLTEQGKVGFADLQNAIKLLTDEGGQFNGVLKAQSETLTGLFSTLTGNTEQLAGELGKLLLPALKDLTSAANDIISGIDPTAIGKRFEQVGKDVAPFFDVLKDGFSENILPALLNFRDTVQAALDKLADFFSKVDENGQVADFLKNILEGITVAFSALVNAISFGIDAVYEFAAPILDALAPAFNTVIRLFNGAISALNDLSGESKNAGGFFGELAKPVAFLANGLSIMVQVLGEIIAGLFNFGDSARSTTPWIKTLGEVVEFITTPVRALAGFVFDLTNGVLEFFGVIESAEQKAARLAAEAAKVKAPQTNFADEDFNDRANQVKEEQKFTQRLKEEEENRRKAAKQAYELGAKDREKAAKEREKLEKERAKVRLELIEDETEKERAAENQRYKEQLETLKTLFKGKEELQGLEAAALRIHQKNLLNIEEQANEKIKEENEKIIKERKDTLKREAEFATEREAVRKEAALNEAENIKALADIQLDIAAEAQKNYLRRLKEQGATETTIQKEQVAFDLLTQKIRIENEIKFQEAILAATAETDTARREQIGKQIELLRSELANVNVDISINADADSGNFKDKLLNLKASIAEALKLDPAQFDTLLGDAKSAFGSFFDSISAFTQIQIEQNDRLIESLDEMIEKQKKVVDEEKKAQEQGAANSLEIEQKRLDGIIAQKEEAEKKNQELQARATRFQLLQDTAAQVSGIATSIVNIIKNTSKVPFVGIALAAIQVAALFALISSARAQARAATKLWRGGLIPLGKDDKTGEGYKIEGTNIQVGGGEFVLRKESVKPNIRFIKNLNDGKYDKVDLDAIFDEKASKGESIIVVNEQRKEETTKETLERLVSESSKKTLETVSKVLYTAQKAVFEIVGATTQKSKEETEKREKSVMELLLFVSKNIENNSVERYKKILEIVSLRENRSTSERVQRLSFEQNNKSVSQSENTQRSSVEQTNKSVSSSENKKRLDFEQNNKSVSSSENIQRLGVEQTNKSLSQSENIQSSGVEQTNKSVFQYDKRQKNADFNEKTSIKFTKENQQHDFKTYEKALKAIEQTEETIKVSKISNEARVLLDMMTLQNMEVLERRKTILEIQHIQNKAKLPKFEQPKIAFSMSAMAPVFATQNLQPLQASERIPSKPKSAEIEAAVKIEMDKHTKMIVQAMNQQTNRIIRNGLYPLQKMGNMAVKNGDLIRISTDANGNINKTVEK